MVVVFAPLRWTLETLVGGLESECDVELFDRNEHLIKVTTERGPPSPFTKSHLRRPEFFGDVQVSRPERVESASIYCHEA